MEYVTVQTYDGTFEMPFYNHVLLTQIKHSVIDTLNYLVFEESLLVLQHLVLLYELLILCLSLPPFLTVVQWGIALRSLQTYITHFLK